MGYRNGCSNNIVSHVNLPKSTQNRVFLSIHMRMGDACDKVELEARREPWHVAHLGRPCIAPQGYDEAVKMMTEKYGVTDILLASDSEEAIVWAKEQKNHDVHWLESDRSKLTDPYSVLSSESNLTLKQSKGWIENREDIGRAEVEGALEEMDFLAHGQVFIGNMGSFYSRLCTSSW
jgi:hypothetical protein